jgi:hypothetical protein
MLADNLVGEGDGDGAGLKGINSALGVFSASRSSISSSLSVLAVFLFLVPSKVRSLISSGLGLRYARLPVVLESVVFRVSLFRATVLIQS